jgi:membrane protease YdiL (CAAX protease family)
MKKCPYCGREYPDTETRCPLDGEELPGGEAASVLTVPPLLNPPLPHKVWTERELRIAELLLVCLTAFGAYIISSFHAVIWDHYYTTGYRSAYSWFNSGFDEATTMGLLWYVLLRRGKCFADLGLKWSGKDIGWSVLLFLGSCLAFKVVYGVFYYSGLTPESHKEADTRVGQIVFGGTIYGATILFQFLNPFFEELIVRAYVMTEIRFLTNSTYKAIVVSTLLQTSYHFYQGGAMALAESASFLVFSIFYAKTNRIAPVILAHMYMDVGATLWHAAQLGH